MPYIKQEDRDRLEADSYDNDFAFGKPLKLPNPKTAGELNYVLTKLCHNYFASTGQNYQAFNDIIGALEGCKLELYRRKVAPYEDVKILENGDV